METLTIRTKKKDEVIDITETIEAYLQAADTESGVCIIFVAHTT